MSVLKIAEQFEKIKKHDRQGSKIKKIRENQKPSYDRETKEKLLEIFNN